MSEPKLLTQSIKNPGFLESKDEEFIYFHTNYTEKTSVVVVELVVIRTVGTQEVRSSGGYAICPIFEFAQEP